MASTPTTEKELTNAFDEVATSPSTSATPSKRLKKLPYDVFLNHRGPDVKHTLAMGLYNTLNCMGLRVFLDLKELESGDFLPQEIEAAMLNASFHIAIFSETYAESPWCLAELSFMLKTGTPIVPVFYHVQPADLRWVIKGKGTYNPAFSKHQKNGRYTPEKLEEWKRALHDVSFYHGHIINNEDDERMLLKKIVNDVSRVVKHMPLMVAKHPVGLNEFVNDFEMTILQSAQSSHRCVQIAGIWGMGGSGKTTLAKQIYNNKFSSVEMSSFLFDVRDAARKNVLHTKQMKLLEDLGVKGVSFDSEEHGKGILARCLRSARVLIILDDVDHIDQLEALLPVTDSLGSGSLIIVTTRELEVLRCWGISSVYKMKALDQFHAEQLFCWHAFLQPSPLDGFEELVKKFLDACNGLPLSLKVFGGHLYGNSRKDYWESQLHKLSRILPDDVKQRLRISYDALDIEEKEIFLDTACFFIEEHRNLAIEAWDGLGWSGLHSWERLLSKCLVELGEDNRIRMHDHLRDLGREIASQQSPHRVWFPEQVINVHNQLTERRIDIRGIMATTDGSTSEVHEGLCGLAASSLGLRFFTVKGPSFNQVIEKLVSKELVWLRYTDSGQRSLPSQLSLKNLRILELYMDKHSEELWETEGNAPVNLQQLTIVGCQNFQRFPKSIGCLKHLKRIILFVGKVRSLPEEFCLLQSLEHLQLNSCHNGLSSLPSCFGNLTNLRHLDLSHNYNLGMLPVSFKQLAQLNYLRFAKCYKLTFNSENDILENMRKLEHLNFEGCVGLQELSHHITDQASLKELYLKGTSIREVPNNIGELSQLRVMEIGNELFTSLPTSLGNLSSLTNLKIDRTSIREVPNNIGDLSKLRVMGIGSEMLTSLPTSLGNLLSLTKLEIRKCPNLESLPDSLGLLNHLEDLRIMNAGVKYLPKSIRKLINLQTLFIEDCPISELNLGPVAFSSSLCNLKKIDLINTEVSKISIYEDCCPGLETLKLWKNHHLTEIESLPTTVKDMTLEYCANVKNIRGVGGLVSLQKLWIIRCRELDELPSFAELASLREFELKGCYKVEKIEGVQHCRSLEKLIADSWWEEPGIESLEHMEGSGRLQLTAYKRSAVEPCIQTLKKWPGEIAICTRAVPDAGSLVKAFAFPNLCVVDSYTDQRIHYSSSCGPTLVQKRSSNMDGIMVCYVVNCVSSSMELQIYRNYASYGQRICEIEVDEGKWVWIGVFTQLSSYLTSESYEIVGRREEMDPTQRDDEVEIGVVMMGEEKSVVEAFHMLLTLLGS